MEGATIVKFVVAVSPSIIGGFLEPLPLIVATAVYVPGERPVIFREPLAGLPGVLSAI